MKSPFAISQYTTWPLTFEQDLRLYRRIGIENIEICESKLTPSEQRRQLQAVQESGLKVTSVQPRFHSPFPNSLRKGRQSPGERMDRLRTTIRLFGEFFPGTTLVVNTGLAPRGDLATAYRVAAQEFRKVAKVAADHGVRIGLEPLNPVFMNTDTFICSLGQAGRLIERVDHPAFGLYLDVWHYWEDQGASAQIRKFSDRIFGVHISDWRLPRAFGDRLLPGAGELPLVELLGDIQAAGYQGVYTLELFSDRRLPDSLWKTPARTARAGKASFEKLWRKLCA